MEILSCLARTLTTAPQISSPSSNCSPIIANSFNQTQDFQQALKRNENVSVIFRTKDLNSKSSFPQKVSKIQKFPTVVLSQRPKNH
jgi:hypothetical protein